MEEGTQWKIDTFVLDPEMIEDTVKIVNEAMKEKIQVNLIIKNRIGGHASLVAEKAADILHFGEEQSIF